MMKTLIIEDEKPAARKLERMLKMYEIEVISVLNSVETAITWLQNNQAPALIFSDIQLGDGLSFEIFKNVSLDNSFIIFTTAFDQYTLKAFKLNSIDYLLKPINNSELKSAIDKFKNISPVKDSFEMLTAIFKEKKEVYKERFLVKAGNLIKIIYTSDISCFYTENKNIYLQNKDRSFPIDFTLDELELMLDPKGFFRISRQSIIRINKIKEITAYTNSRYKVMVENISEPFLVSRERVRDFKLWLGE